MSIRAQEPILALVGSNHNSLWMPKEPEHVLIFPAGRLSWMLVQIVATFLELDLI